MLQALFSVAEIIQHATNNWHMYVSVFREDSCLCLLQQDQKEEPSGTLKTNTFYFRKRFLGLDLGELGLLL